jgi:hypothetical protein
MSMLPTAYIETSIISYLTSRGSRDPIAAAHQELTRDWWDRRRTRFDIHVAELVVQEASRGDAAAAHARLEAIAGYPVLRVTAESCGVPCYRPKPQPTRFTSHFQRSLV